MLSPLRNDSDVRKAARGAIGGRPEDMEKVLDDISHDGPSSEFQDVATVGLMAMQGVETGGETSELARRHAGKVALEVLTDPDSMRSVQGVGRVGERLTDPANAFALNLSGAETVLEAIQGASIPGAMGQAVAFTLQLGEKLKTPGQTATRHSAYLAQRPDQMLGPGESFDFVGTAAVYHAAFSNLIAMDLSPQVGDVITSSQLADLGNAMILYTGEANKNYDGYLQTPDTPRTVAREVLSQMPNTDKVNEDTERWARLGMALLPDNPQAAGASVMLEAISQKKSADSVSMMAVGRKALELLPEGCREGFARQLIDQSLEQRRRETDEPVKGGWAMLDQASAQVASGSSAAEAVRNGLEQLSESTGDPWLEHGSSTPSNAGVASNGQVVLVPGGRVKVRQPRPPVAQPDQVVMERREY